MKRLAMLTVAALLAAILIFPPWHLSWRQTDSPADGALGPVADNWAGFHFWTYTETRPERMVAWDGVNTGGHIALVGYPRLAVSVWLGLIAGVGLCIVLLVRSRGESGVG